MSIFNMIGGGGGGSFDGLTWEAYKTVSHAWNSNTRMYTVTCNQLSAMPEAGACQPVGNAALTFVGDTAKLVVTGVNNATLLAFSRTNTGFTATISAYGGSTATSYGYFLVPTNERANRHNYSVTTW